MKNILVYYNWQLTIPFYGIIIDHINKLAEGDTMIYLMTCNGIIKNCLSNPLNDPKVCSICKFVKKSGESSIAKNVKFITIEEFLKEEDTLTDFVFNSIDDIKKIQYKGVKIGYGALSSYVSYTRNQEPVFNQEVIDYFNDFFKSQINIVNALEHLDSKIKFEEVYLYNGRYADVRPVYDYFKNKNIFVAVLESVNNGTSEFYKEIFPNVLPQDIDYRTNEIKRVWEGANLSEEKKFLKAEDFFKSKRAAIDPRGDIKVFTAEQDKNSLPENFDSSKTNISIFNSSEDEFVALGEEWEKYRIFKTQEDGITKICAHFLDDQTKHFYLRVHPNLKGVKYGYVKRLDDLALKFKNLTVLNEDSKISSYNLLDNSDRVIVFGSSIGFEAVYANKPVILLGGTFYYFLDTAYIPTMPSELYDLIKLRILEPKPKLGAYMFAYYLMNHKKFSELIDLNPIPLKLFNKKIGHYFSFTKLFGSPLLFRLIYQVRIIILKKYTAIFNKKTIPSKGL
jgi:hypothetical protein